MPELPTAIVESLRGVHDPCCREKGISVVDMGLVRSVDVDADRHARVELLLTSGWCPFAARVLTSRSSAVARTGVDRRGGRDRVGRGLDHRPALPRRPRQVAVPPRTVDRAGPGRLHRGTAHLATMEEPA